MSARTVMCDSITILPGTSLSHSRDCSLKRTERIEIVRVCASYLSALMDAGGHRACDCLPCIALNLMPPLVCMVCDVWSVMYSIGMFIFVSAGSTADVVPWPGCMEGPIPAQHDLSSLPVVWRYVLYLLNPRSQLQVTQVK